MRISILLALSLLAISPLPTLAQQPAPDSPEPEIVRVRIRLDYLKPGKIAKILFGAVRDHNGQLRFKNPLVPKGIKGLSTSSADNSLIVEGTLSAIQLLNRGLTIADVETVHPGKSRTIVILRPTRLKAQELNERVLKLPDAGVTEVRGEQIGIDGKPEWVDAAILLAMRAEMEEP